MHVRYTGPDEARDLALPGGFISFPRRVWVDLEQACDAAGIAGHHLAVIVPNLGPDWETSPDAPATKPARSKPARAKTKTDDVDADRARVDARLARLHKEP